MKRCLPLIFFFFVKYSFSQTSEPPNIFIITTDGFRWQEVFRGADSVIINNPSFVKDTSLLKQYFWTNDPEQRKKLLMPFVWNVIAKKGSLYGNRDSGNQMSVANPYRFSYAGYNELFTGYADRSVIVNQPKNNSNRNVFDFINIQPGYENRVAAFASWNLFDYIFNKPSGSIYLNSGYRPILHDSLSETELIVNGIQENSAYNARHTRSDMLTFVAAKEYIETKHPKVVYIGFGETDEAAHHGNYDEYLESAHAFDNYLSQLWYLINKDPFYKNNTSIIITTDHGRGKKPTTWVKHDMFTKGSDATWLLTLGPGLTANGQFQKENMIYSEQVAQTIAGLLGFEFNSNHPVSEAMTNVSR